MKANLVMMWNRNDSAYIQAEVDGLGAVARTTMFWIDHVREGKACVKQLTDTLQSMGYSYIVRCSRCGNVSDSIESDPNCKTETADYMYNKWYAHKIEWERVTREYEQAQSRCQCRAQWAQLSLPGFEMTA